jgi:hypothetical protein
MYQSSPAYVYAYITNDTNLKTGTFTSTNAAARVILSASTTPAAPATSAMMRVWKLSANRALFLMDRTLLVLEVQPNDDIVVKNGRLVNFNTNLYTVQNYNGPYNYVASGAMTGSLLQGWYIRDNVAYFAVRDNSTTPTSMNLYKVSYDSTGDTLTSTLINKFSITSANSSYFTRSYLQSIPGSTKKLFTIRVSSSTSSSLTTSYIQVAGFVDTATDTLSSTLTPYVAGSAHVYVPLRENLVLALIGLRTFAAWTGSAWQGQTIYNAATPTSNIYPLQAEALDANYFVFWNIGEGSAFSDLSSGTVNMTMRVGRYVDPTFGQTSAATNGAPGMNVTTNVGQLFYDQDIINRIGSDAFAIYGRESVNLKPQIKLFYQPGA